MGNVFRTNGIKWHSCSTCKYYKVCGGSSSNPKKHPCKGWIKKEKEKKQYGI